MSEPNDKITAGLRDALAGRIARITVWAIVGGPNVSARVKISGNVELTVGNNTAVISRDDWTKLDLLVKAGYTGERP